MSDTFPYKLNKNPEGENYRAVGPYHHGAWKTLCGASDECAELNAAYSAGHAAADAELRKAREIADAELHDAEAFMSREGYRRCDIAACNCGSWHGGHMRDTIAELRAECERLRKERDERVGLASNKTRTGRRADIG